MDEITTDIEFDLSWSTPCGEIAKALVIAQSGLGHVEKTAKAVYGKFAPLNACMNAIRPAMNKAGIAIIQIPKPCEDGVNLETAFLHSSGEWVRGVFHMPAQDHTNPQRIGAALTYARRYAINAMSTLVADDDDDGNYAAGDKAASGGKSWDPKSENAQWKGGGISPKQRETITKILKRKFKDDLSAIADFLITRFGEKVESEGGGASLAKLSKGEASEFISELLAENK